MTISIVITTYGSDEWRELAWSRAYPSTVDQGALEVIVHHEPEMPIGPARNAAALLASGEHLVFLDADDEFAPGYIRAMENAISHADDPDLFVGHPAVRYVANGRARADLMRPIGDLRHDNFLVVGAAISRRLFMFVGGFSNYDHGYEDWSLWAKAWKQGAQITPVFAATYVAHVNRHSRHRTLWRNRREQVKEHQRIQAELFPEGV